MAEKMQPKAATPVRATTHADTHSNSPTAEVSRSPRPPVNGLSTHTSTG
jgi:hypothetical protein